MYSLPQGPRFPSNLLPTGQTLDPDAIATLFIANIPNDMAEREFVNIFRFAMGFLAATLKDNVNKNDPVSKKQKIGFVRFRTREEAIQARDALNSRVSDGRVGHGMKAELAQKNLHVKGLEKSMLKQKNMGYLPPNHPGYYPNTSAHSLYSPHSIQACPSSYAPSLWAPPSLLVQGPSYSLSGKRSNPLLQSSVQQSTYKDNQPWPTYISLTPPSYSFSPHILQNDLGGRGVLGSYDNSLLEGGSAFAESNFSRTDSGFFAGLNDRKDGISSLSSDKKPGQTSTFPLPSNATRSTIGGVQDELHSTFGSLSLTTENENSPSSPKDPLEISRSST